MQLLFTASVTPVIHNWWDIKDQNAQLVELIMFFKVRCTTPNTPLSYTTAPEFNTFWRCHQWSRTGRTIFGTIAPLVQCVLISARCALLCKALSRKGEFEGSPLVHILLGHQS